MTYEFGDDTDAGDPEFDLPRDTEAAIKHYSEKYGLPDPTITRQIGKGYDAEYQIDGGYYAARIEDRRVMNGGESHIEHQIAKIAHET